MPTAGDQTIYLLGDESSGAVSLADVTLTLLFVPTIHGTTEVQGQPNPNPDIDHESAPLTAADVAAEQAEARRFHQAKVAERYARCRHDWPPSSGR